MARYFVVNYETGEKIEVASEEKGEELLKKLKLAALVEEIIRPDGTIERRFIKIKKEK